MPATPPYTGGVPTVAQIDDAVLMVMSDAAYDGKTVEVLAHQAAGLLAKRATPNAVLIEVHRVAERVERVQSLAAYLTRKTQALLIRAGADAITAYDLLPELRTGAFAWLAEHGGEDYVDFDQIDEDVLIGLLRRGSAGRIVYDKDLPHGGGYKMVDPPAQEAEPSAALAKMRQLTDQAERARQRVSPRPEAASTAQQIDAKLLEVLGRRREAAGPTWRGTAVVVEEVLDELHGLGSRVSSVYARLAVLVGSGAIQHGDSEHSVRLVPPEYPGGKPSPEALDDAILGVLTSYLTAGGTWVALENLYGEVVLRLARRAADGDVALGREDLSVRLDELSHAGRVELDAFTGRVSLRQPVSSKTASSPARPQGTRRLTINISETTHESLTKLASAFEASQTDVVRRAVALLNRLVDAQAAGQEVQLVNPRTPDRVRVIDVS
jgi:hypothetical protein